MTEDEKYAFCVGHVFGDSESKAPATEDIEEALQVLLEHDSENELIPVFKAAISQFRKLWLKSREAREAHEKDLENLGECHMKLFYAYMDGGVTNAQRYIEDLELGTQELALKVLKFYTLIYPRSR
jgi:hypothetical protein